MSRRAYAPRARARKLRDAARRSASDANADLRRRRAGACGESNGLDRAIACRVEQRVQPARANAIPEEYGHDLAVSVRNVGCVELDLASYLDEQAETRLVDVEAETRPPGVGVERDTIRQLTGVMKWRRHEASHAGNDRDRDAEAQELDARVRNLRSMRRGT